MRLEEKTVSAPGVSKPAIQIEPEWLDQLQPEFEQPYMQELRAFLKHEYAQGKVIYPLKKEYFAAFNSTPFSDVKVVILGQDPYHGPGQAHGLCFSVRKGIARPPSLQNIFKEIERDLGMKMSNTGDLTPWAQQGVLLLNATLTVEAGQAGSHQGKGWESFTDAAIRLLGQKRRHLVFVLWGSYAQKKGELIDSSHHLILKAPHPSPLSAHRGFLGCGHFSKINQYLRAQDIEPIDWQL